MHVVQVNYAWDPELTDPERLLERYTTLTGWSRALVSAGAGTTVVQRFARDARIVSDGVEYLFRRPRGVNRTAACLGGEIVHVNGLIFPLQTMALALALGSRSAIVLQDHASGDPPPIATWAPARAALRRRAFSMVDAFLFAAEEQGHAWRRAGLIAPGQPVFEVMEAAAEIRRVDRAAARLDSGVGGSPALVWVGRLNANKDPLTILAGFEQALPRLPNARLTMVFQEGELIDRVRRRIDDSAALRERVHLAGAVPHGCLAAFYSAADLFVLGSHHEGSGYALLEACACGAIPVVTDIPSFRRITDGGAFGALWNAGDPGSFADALLEVASRDRSALSEQAAADAARRFSWPAIGAEAVGVYRQVLRLSRRPAPWTLT